VRATDWRDHRTLGGGIVDWTRLLRRISSLGYSGAFALELEEPDEVAALQQSRDHFRRVLTHIHELRRDRP
jgi:sugar phosphate isomerase/epimerase